MNAYTYYKMRWPLDNPAPDYELPLLAALRCHVASAAEHLITWREAWGLIRFDISEAIRTAPDRARRAWRARRIRRAWARAFLA